MPEQSVAPYGSWRSPVTAEMVASGGVSLSSPIVDGTTVYWIEGRPSEGGRNVIVCKEAVGTARDVLPLEYNARSRVHEYGGGAYTARDGLVVFVDFSDNRLYRLAETGATPLTPEGPMRYADLYLDLRRQRVLCIREDHSGEGEAVNTVVSVPLTGGSEGDVLVSGNDFYASPRVSPDGDSLTWITWHHPNMPWDGTELWVAGIDCNGRPKDVRQVAGGESESVIQPEWSPDGTLYFLSDRNGWWNLYRLSPAEVEPVTQLEAEIGGPQWQFGESWYCFLEADTVACIVNRSSLSELALVNAADRQLHRIPIPYSSLHDLATLDGTVLSVAASPTDATALVQIDVDTSDVTVLRHSIEQFVNADYLSVPREVRFPTTGGATAYGWFYAPHNADYAAPDGELPPLIVLSHGGPTGDRGPALSPALQFWTSRGFAVLDVNYRGSSGFGRPYREALNGEWGVVDVDDCACGARYLVDAGLVDGNKLIIRGGSAGGYTTLSALTFRDVFRAGASHYGIADLEPFVQDTHKFESRYIDRLIGPYPQRQDVYRARSPIHFVEQISVPVILFQGLDDKVVPPNQAEMMIDVLQKRGLPFAYVAFEGEGHGFRKGENVKRALEAEMYFYSRVFGFELGEKVEPIPIENLRAS